MFRNQLVPLDGSALGSVAGKVLRAAEAPVLPYRPADGRPGAAGGSP